MSDFKINNLCLIIYCSAICLSNNNDNKKLGLIFAFYLKTLSVLVIIFYFNFYLSLKILN